MSNEARKKNPHAVKLGRKGGLVGGKRRAQNLSSDELKAAASHAAKSRWAAYRQRVLEQQGRA